MAKNVQSRYKIATIEPPNKHEIESEDFASSSLIMPQQPERQFFELDEEQQLAYQSPGISLIYEIEHESPTGKHRKFGLIMHISKNTYNNIESWDKNDIF